MHGGGFMGGKRDKPSGRVPTRRLVRQTAGLFKSHTAGVAAIAALVVITSGAGVVNPILIKVVFDTALFPTTTITSIWSICRWCFRGSNFWWGSWSGSRS